MLDLGVGALLHDIGKAELPERLRQREEHFSAAEHKLYETHVALGIVQARRMELAPGAALVIAQHHEHSDGSGFPLKLQSDRITVPSRIAALVNRYDQAVQPGQSEQGDHPARGGGADVCAGQEQLRPGHFGRLHQNDGGVSGRLGGAAHR